MSQALPLPPPGFDSLSVDEQIAYVQSLWDHIAARPEDVPVPDWHREVLAERLAAHEASKDQRPGLGRFRKGSHRGTKRTGHVMKRRTFVRPEAQADIREAARWATAG